MKTLHTSSHYLACLHEKAGLIIQSTRKHGGVVLRPDHVQYGAYVDALSTAVDTQEGDALCRALLSAN